METNAFIAETFEELADLSELAGEVLSRASAYRVFAGAIRTMAEPLSAVAARGELGAVPGVDAGVVAEAEALLATGSIPVLDRLRSEVPSSLLDVIRVPGIGPKRARNLWLSLGVASLGELAYACKENRLLAMYGERAQERTLAAVTFLLEGAGHMGLARALEVGGAICEALREAGASAAEIAGEARRGAEVVTEIVVVVGGIDSGEAADALVGHEAVRAVTDLSSHGFRVTTHGKTSARVRVVPPGDLVAALLVETGDAAHVRWLAETARARGLDLSVLTRRASSETAVYRALGLDLVPPELREGAAPSVPGALLGFDDVTGVFHVHTDWSDGTGSILSMARAAAKAGYRFLGISDHSKAAAYARGLSEARLAEQAGAIEVVRREVPGLTVLHGSEVDILESGELDLADEALAELDFVIASVHTHTSQDAETMTRRLIRAVSHPLVTMLGHPTGRLLLARKGASFDLRAVAEAAAANETYLEINANPNRLDLSDTLVRRARVSGAEFVINPDAHEAAGLADTRLGVRVARRAGLTASEVLNASEPDAVLARLQARRHRVRHALGI